MRKFKPVNQTNWMNFVALVSAREKNRQRKKARELKKLLRAQAMENKNAN